MKPHLCNFSLEWNVCKLLLYFQLQSHCVQTSMNIHNYDCPSIGKVSREQFCYVCTYCSIYMGYFTYSIYTIIVDSSKQSQGHTVVAVCCCWTSKHHTVSWPLHANKQESSYPKLNFHMGVFRLTVACIVGKVSTYFCKVWIFCFLSVHYCQCTR